MATKYSGQSRGGLETRGGLERGDLGLSDSGVQRFPLDPSYHYIRNQGFQVYGFSLWNHWLQAIVVTGSSGVIEGGW